MKVLKIDKKTKTKTEQIKLYLAILCTLNDLVLSNTELLVLAFYIQYKISKKTDELIIASGIVKDLPTLRNVKYNLRKGGFLRRDKKEYKTYELNGGDMNFDDNEMTLIVKLDNR